MRVLKFVMSSSCLALAVAVAVAVAGGGVVAVVAEVTNSRNKIIASYASTQLTWYNHSENGTLFSCHIMFMHTFLPMRCIFDVLILVWSINLSTSKTMHMHKQ